MKTKEELAQIKNEYEVFTTKLQELTEDELGYVTGGLATGPSAYGMTDTSSIILRGVATIGETSSLFVVDEENIEWNSKQDIPTQPGEYKIGK